MGWKNVKEHYRIGHIVSVTTEGICIGSPYIHNIIVVGRDGLIKKEMASTSNDDLVRYAREFRANPERLRTLIEAPDVFGPLTTVYTWDGGNILAKQCEEIGYPNVTTDGQLMFNNAFSTDRSKVLAWAIRDARYGVQSAQENIADLQGKLATAQGRLADETNNLTRLLAE